MMIRGQVTMAEPDVLFEDGKQRRRPGLGPADGVDAGPLPRPRLLLQRGAPAPVVG